MWHLGGILEQKRSINKNYGNLNEVWTLNNKNVSMWV